MSFICDSCREQKHDNCPTRTRDEMGEVGDKTWCDCAHKA